MGKPYFWSIRIKLYFSIFELVNNPIMRSFFLTLSFVFTSQLAFSQLWIEDFSGELDGATSGTAGGTIGGTWTSTYVGGGTFSKQTFGGLEYFQVSDTDAEGEWSNVGAIDISGTSRAIIEMTVVGLLVGTGDYIRCYYRLDGGPEILFFEQIGGLLNFTQTGTAIVTGGTLDIVVRSNVTSPFGTFTFDDIVVTGVNTLYSRKTGNWDDVSVGNGTWSAVGLGGVSCDCSPLPTDYLIIGNSNTVNINLPATAGGIEIRNTGSLMWTVSGVDLNIGRGILQVDVGGLINRNGQTGVQIDFDRGVITSFINNGTITSEDIEVTVPNAIVNISGNGSISLTGDFNLLEDDIIVNNDLTGSFIIGDDLLFDSPIFFFNARFINNQKLTINSDILVGTDTDDNAFVNSAGATLNVVNLDFTSRDFDFLNSGTVNQSGNFINIDPSDTHIDNLGTGVWNWSLTPNATFDPDLNLVLNCTALGNTFNYNGAGDQDIISASYHHLSLSNSGAKNGLTSSFSVAGNWTVGGTATFAEGTSTVTLNGTGAQSITNPFGETFNNLIINNSSVSPITFNDAVAVSSVLTMTDGNVDLNGTTFILSSNAAGALVHNLVSTAGWMYGGAFQRALPAFAIALGAAGGLFPLGSSTDWRPFFIGKSNAGSSSGNMTVSHTDAATTSIVSIADTNPVATIVRRHDSFWTVSTAGISAGSWDLRAGGTNFGTVGAAGDLRMATSTGVVGTNAAGAGGPTDWRVNRTGLTFGQLANSFHVASTDAVNTPLPIELLDFIAFIVDDGVQLHWETASELNNDFFMVQRSLNAEEWVDLTKIKGAGTVSEKKTYSVLDSQPYAGASYYRLKQTDFDGQISFSPIEKVEFIEQNTIQVFPNPSDGIFYIANSSQLDVESIRVVNSLGQVVFPLIKKEDTISIYLNSLSQGIYILQVWNGTFLSSVRLVKRN